MELAEVEEREIKEERTRSKVGGGNGTQEELEKTRRVPTTKGGEGIRKVGAFQYIKNWGGVAPAWRDIRKPGQ